MRILFIGNSYTYFFDMPQILCALLGENGVPACVDAVTVGGRRLCENLDPDDGSHKQIKQNCAAGQYDALILQEQSYLALVDFAQFLAGVRGCTDMVGAKRTLLYATWGRKQGSELLTAHGWTNQSMTQGLADAYDKAALDVGAVCAHVGKCFLEIRAAYPEIELYDPDLSHPSYTGSCVAALALYKKLTGRLPEHTGTLKLDADIAQGLLGIIDKAVV